jgi:hypothetical protein
LVPTEGPKLLVFPADQYAWFTAYACNIVVVVLGIKGILERLSEDPLKRGTAKGLLLLPWS